MFEPSIKEILTRASELAGQDLCAIYEARREHAEEIRAELPRKARRIFDREMARQYKTRAEKQQKQAIKINKKNQRILAKLDKALKARGIEIPRPKEIEYPLWRQTKHILLDTTGWAARFYARICWHKVGVGLAHRAALCYDEHGNARYSYAGNSPGARRARHVLATCLLFFGLCEPTGRRDHGWMRIIKGIPQDAFLACLADPSTGEKPHRNTFDGTHRDCEDSYTGGTVGYLTAMKRIGICYTRQAKWRPGDDPSKQKGWEDILPEEMAGYLHPSGWFTSTVRYWIVADEFNDPVDAAKRARLWLAWLSGTIPWQQDEQGRFVPMHNQDLQVSRPEKPPD